MEPGTTILLLVCFISIFMLGAAIRQIIKNPPKIMENYVVFGIILTMVLGFIFILWMIVPITTKTADIKSNSTKLLIKETKIIEYCIIDSDTLHVFSKTVSEVLSEVNYEDSSKLYRETKYNIYGWIFTDRINEK